MRLLKLVLSNFKGVNNFTFDAQGASVSIYGDNATGKTTVFDAFNWLLFDKDSANKKDFQIKTLDKDGNVLHHMDHEVEGTIEVNGRGIMSVEMIGALTSDTADDRNPEKLANDEINANANTETIDINAEKVQENDSTNDQEAPGQQAVEGPGF